MRRTIFALLFALLPWTLSAQEEATEEGPMTVERIVSILAAIDPDATLMPRGVGLTISDIPVLVMIDPLANRMRALVPVASADGLTEADLLRVMQANFDTAMDARYAVANDRLWSVFIHPLRELQREQLISGLAQTVVLARTYGSAYSSGLIIFGQGDSLELHRELFEDLLERGEAL